MHRMSVFTLVALLVLGVGAARADDVTGAERLLCAAVQATYCLEGGECASDLPWNLNIPEFIEIDLAAKRFATTAASGLNRTTTVEHLSREGGAIVLQGSEMGRAFSFVISEESGLLAAAVATEGRVVAVFGACTPLSGPPTTAAE